MEHHGAALYEELKDREKVEGIKEDYTRAGLSSATRKALDYAVKLTCNPKDVGEEDLNSLREEGFDDREILDICQIVSYFNFVNRMAEGLGVELEK